ncbi:MAG TPA: type II secretion system F family protein, partial [Pirellulaceae bacterium]
LHVLTELCYRVGTSLHAGIDARRTWDREAERMHGRDQRILRQIADQTHAGENLADAIQGTGNYFPPLVRNLIRVGDAAGGLDTILLKLAEHYRRVIANRRALLRNLTWPLVELSLVILIVGFLIFIPEWLPKHEGKLADILGFGLVGWRGLVIYAGGMAALGTVLALVLVGIRDDRFGARWILTFAEQLPGFGPPLRDLALGRLAWSLSLTTNTPMNLKDSVALALDASLLPRIVRQRGALHRDLDQGRTLTEAMTKTRQFPAEFLDVVDVGEQTGMLSESIDRLSRNYEERAQFAIQRLAVVAGVALWLLVVMIVIALILRMASGYASLLMDLSR